jgi:hypothetical protein
MSDKVNVIKDTAKSAMYDFNDSKNIKICTNRRGVVVDVTASHYDMYRERDHLELVGANPKYMIVKTQRGVKIKTTERWFSEWGEKFGYTPIKTTAKK